MKNFKKSFKYSFFLNLTIITAISIATLFHLSTPFALAETKTDGEAVVGTTETNETNKDTLSMKALEGTYDYQSNKFPPGQVSFQSHKDGTGSISIQMGDSGFLGPLGCAGSSTFSGNFFRSQMICGIKVDIQIDLTNVKNFDYFQTSISSSFDRRPQELIFERIEKIGSQDKAKGTPITDVSTMVDIKEMGGRYKIKVTPSGPKDYDTPKNIEMILKPNEDGMAQLNINIEGDGRNFSCVSVVAASIKDRILSSNNVLCGINSTLTMDLTGITDLTQATIPVTLTRIGGKAHEIESDIIRLTHIIE